MKTILLFLSIGIFFNSFSQINPGYGMIHHESCDFDFDITPWKRLFVDTTNTNNDWAVGSTSKPFFGSSSSLPNAIMTDTLNPYSSNNLSYFDLTFKAWDNSGFPYNMYIQFDHKYETDTLIDGGFITTSHDSGQTWQNVIFDSTSCFWCTSNGYQINSENLYTSNDTLANGEFGFSGSSEWKTTILQWIWMLPVKQQPSDTMIVRFNFLSDGIQTNKDGWIIDNIVIGEVDLGSSINELSNKLEVSLFPNLVSSFFNYSVKDKESLESLTITNLEGENVFTIKKPKQSNKVNVSQFSSGVYFVKFNSKGKTSVKRIVIQN
jgi:type IX secretion system substrate protein